MLERTRYRRGESSSRRDGSLCPHGPSSASMGVSLDVGAPVGFRERNNATPLAM